MSSIDELEKQFDELVKSFHLVSADEIPDIDLYMDQVTTFMEQKLSPSTRDPENDKILTKAMINNYAKNDLLTPPVRKKYGMDHMLLLLLIYYMKSFLSISDIDAILAPVRDRYTDMPQGKKKKADSEGSTPGISLKEVYTEVTDDIRASLPDLCEDARKTFEEAKKSFQDKEQPDREILQEFELICRFCAEIYIKKLYIERLLDAEKKKADKKQEK